MLKVLAVILGGVCCLPSLAADHASTLNIVFIGDSITRGVFADHVSADDAPPAHAAAQLSKQPNVARVNFSNQGRAGHTTVDVLPATQTDFPEIERAATQLQREHPGHLIFSIMLGTNDSAMDETLGAPVAPEDYRKNLTTIIDRLLQDYPECQIILQRPTWYSPNTDNGTRYLAKGLKRLQSYFPEIDAVVEAHRGTHQMQVFEGDKKAFEAFKKNYRAYLLPEPGRQGTFYLHPNPRGAAILGSYWAEAIETALQGDRSTTHPR